MNKIKFTFEYYWQNYKGEIAMENRDSIHLLKECDAGTKMAIISIDDVIDDVENAKLRQLLIESKDHHKKLLKEIHAMLDQLDIKEKDPSTMATLMSWVKTNSKLIMNDDDTVIADLMTEGCDMGVKSLHKYLNQYPNASHKVKEICNRLISLEETLCEKLRAYL